MREIKLMPDYQCYPLWEASKGKVGNINPDNLPISDSIKLELLAWANLYDGTLNLDDPAASGFKDTQEANEFRQIGNRLGIKLQEELGKGVLVQVKL